MHFDAPTMPLDDILRNRQSKTKTTVLSGVIGFEERLEDLVAKRSRYSRPVVCHLYFDSVGGSFTKRDGDDAAAVLDGIFDDVGDSSCERTRPTRIG